MPGRFARWSATAQDRGHSGRLRRRYTLYWPGARSERPVSTCTTQPAPPAHYFRQGGGGFTRGAIVHVGISVACGEVLARTLPRRRSIAWGAAAGLAIGVVNVGLIGRRFPAINSLPVMPQIADNVAFGTLFAVVVDWPSR